MTRENPIPARASRGVEPQARQRDSGHRAAVPIHSQLPTAAATRQVRYPLTDDIENEDRFYAQRPPTSVRRYRSTDERLVPQGTTRLIVYRRRIRKQQAASEQR